ncbi:Aromatic ring hydroxylase [Pyrobaculum oguniense TE7]|uniref:Aromatic ring hydroxylase n=1 Tax=Pyrobaculum oguniense (strain DSM 13380 / JCM 10595 / TE7) TaxID=698757 RepID=H6QAC4_PYROT|nr:Aromatic ring hydroxylase [Pyrobaculum oguniense TE7]
MGLRTGQQYVEGIRHRQHASIYVMGKRVTDVTTNLFLKPSVLAFKATFDAAFEEDTRDLARVYSPIVGEEVNRFNSLHTSPQDLVAKVKLLRKLSHKTGTCFQRCVGWDALNTLYIVTRRMADKGKKIYYDNFIKYVADVQKKDLALAGAMTDVKGVRTLRPSEQPNPDAYVRVVEERDDGIIVRGAKANITGIAVVDEVVVMPTRAMSENDAAYAISFAIPLDSPGVKIVVGRQLNDARRLEGGEVDGLPYMFNHEGLLILDDVFVPWERVFLYKEWKEAGVLVEIFSSYHRQGYAGCKSGLGDVIIGATHNLAKQIGVVDKSHVQEKLTEMVFLNETMYSAGLAASWEGRKLVDGPGGFWVNPMYANVTKHLVTRFPYEIAKLSHDIAGGLLGTAPSEFDLKNPEIKALIEKYLQGVPEFTAETRLRMIRLLENTSLSVAYLVESVHGAGSPQAQRISMQRLYDVDAAEKIAKFLAGMGNRPVDFRVEPHKKSEAEKT